MVTIAQTMRPTAVTGLILSGGTSSGLSTAGDQFYIVVNSATMTHSTKLQEITGDGDRSPRYIANYYIYADWIIRGYAVGNQVIGILSMTDATTPDNPTDQSALVEFTIGSGRTLKGIFWVHNIVVEWARTSAYVGLSMALKSTARDADGLVAYTEGTPS